MVGFCKTTGMNIVVRNGLIGGVLNLPVGGKTAKIQWTSVPHIKYTRNQICNAGVTRRSALLLIIRYLLAILAIVTLLSNEVCPSLNKMKNPCFQKHISLF